MLPIGAKSICYLNTFLTWISNGLLIFLIVRKSPSIIANYKYLMLLFAIFGLIFGVFEITNQAFLHFYQGCYIVFSINPLGLPRWLSFRYLALNTSCFMMTLSLLVFHFLYRYFAICKPHLQYLFSWPYCIYFPALSIFLTVGACSTTVFMAGESEITDKYIKTTMLQTYGLKKEDFTYVSTVFYRTDPTTLTEHLSTPDLIFVNIIGSIINIGFSIILYCWLKIRNQLIQLARQHQNQSRKTLEMQRQLFKCLVFQTVLPIFALFIPASMMFIFPIFKLEPGPFEGIFFSLVTTQPFIDAIIPMYFITDYRKAIMRFLRWKKFVNSQVSHG